MKRIIAAILIGFTLTLSVNVHPLTVQASEVTPAAVSEQQTQNPFFTPEINALIEQDQALIAQRGYGNLIIPKELSNFTVSNIPDNAMYVANKLHAAGFETYICGGCVRDFILGKKTMDYDITTNASYEQIAAMFGDDFHMHYAGSVGYGGVIVNGELIDLATYSAIPDYCISMPNMPSVNERSLLTDSIQRDLTINAMYIDPFSGDIIDYHGGLRDCRDGIIDTVCEPNAELSGDPRVLIRAVRFMTRYDFKMAPRVQEAYKNFDEYIVNVPSNTVSDNLIKFFNGGYAVKSFVNLEKYGMIDYLFPFYKNSSNRTQYREYLIGVMYYFDGIDFDNLSSEEGKTLILSSLMFERFLELKETMSVDQAIDATVNETNSVYDIDTDLLKAAIRCMYEGLEDAANAA